MTPKKERPAHIKKLILIAAIMILAFIGFALTIELGKETSKELTIEATHSNENAL